MLTGGEKFSFFPELPLTGSGRERQSHINRMGPELWEAPARGEAWSCSLERNLEAEKPYGAMVQLLRNPAFLIVGGGGEGGGGEGGGGGGGPPTN